MGHALLPPGTLIGGNYQIEATLGHGTYGAVYRASDLAGGRVALKVIGFDPDVYVDDFEEFSARVEREIKALRRLNSSSVVRLHDWGTHGDAFYLAMEYVEGRTLTEIIAAEGRLSIERAVGLAREILRGLADAHVEGIVHRDLKPDNVMVVERAIGGEEIRILDFGVARIQARSHATYETAEGTRVFGTPAYMAPEQGLGKVSAQSDLYAVGTLLFEMITGRLPFSAVKPLQLMLRKINDPLPPVLEELGIAPDVVTVVHRALARRPTDRFIDAQAMYSALSRARLDGVQPATLMFGDAPPDAVAEGPIEERPLEIPPERPPWWSPLARIAERLFGTARRRVMTLGVVLLVAAAGALLLGQGDPAPTPRPSIQPDGTSGGRVDDPFLERLKRTEAELPP